MAGIPEDIETGEHERKGTKWTAAAYIVTTMLGAGLLALPWSLSQLGWLGGPLALLMFASTSYYTSTLLADCYRAPDPVTGSRNRSYIDAVKAFLSPTKVFLCAVAQTTTLWGSMVSFTVASAKSMNAVNTINCYHHNGRDATCNGLGPLLAIIFGVVQLILSQLPSLEHMTWSTCIVAAMSCTYSLIGLGLSFAKLLDHRSIKGGIKGVTELPPLKKIFVSLQALGNIAFAYSFAEILIETQDTLRSPPDENKTMKKATFWGVIMTTVFYLFMGGLGYAAFGHSAPGNILTGSAFYEPFWLVDIGNLCVVIQLAGAYQICAQPVYCNLERLITKKWPQSKFVNRVYTIKIPYNRWGTLNLVAMRVVLRSSVVILTTLVATLFPFFNSILGLLGAISFFPLTIYFPITMHIAQQNIAKGQRKWVFLQIVMVFGLFISLVISVGSVAEIYHAFKTTRLFSGQRKLRILSQTEHQYLYTSIIRCDLQAD